MYQTAAAQRIGARWTPYADALQVDLRESNLVTRLPGVKADFQALEHFQYAGQRGISQLCVLESPEIKSSDPVVMMVTRFIESDKWPGLELANVTHATIKPPALYALVDGDLLEPNKNYTYVEHAPASDGHFLIKYEEFAYFTFKPQTSFQFVSHHHSVWWEGQYDNADTMHIQLHVQMPMTLTEVIPGGSESSFSLTPSLSIKSLPEVTLSD